MATRRRFAQEMAIHHHLRLEGTGQRNGSAVSDRVLVEATGTDCAVGLVIFEAWRATQKSQVTPDEQSRHVNFRNTFVDKEMSGMTVAILCCVMSWSAESFQTMSWHAMLSF